MTYFLNENEPNTNDFNWDIQNGVKPNKKLKRVPNGFKVYCHEPYAQALLDSYNQYFSGSPQIDDYAKDLVEGMVYPCKIVVLKENEALAQTNTGQTIYIDLKKELKDAEDRKSVV